MEVIEREEPSESRPPETDAERHRIIHVFEVMPHQHRNVDGFSRRQHGVVAVGHIDERELLFEAHVLEIQTGERRSRERAVERPQVDGGRRLKQHHALAPVDLVEEHFPLVAVEVQVPDVAPVRDEEMISLLRALQLVMRPT